MVTLDDGLPDEVIVSGDRAELRLVWESGRSTAFHSSFLRGACRCAWCTRDRILDRSQGPFDHVRLVGVDALGSHGLHLKFSDGHERGIYPWAYLQELGFSLPVDAARHMPAADNPIQIGSDP